MFKAARGVFIQGGNLLTMIDGYEDGRKRGKDI